MSANSRYLALTRKCMLGFKPTKPNGIRVIVLTFWSKIHSMLHINWKGDIIGEFWRNIKCSRQQRQQSAPQGLWPKSSLDTELGGMHWREPDQEGLLSVVGQQPSRRSGSILNPGRTLSSINPVHTLLSRDIIKPYLRKYLVAFVY